MCAASSRLSGDRYMLHAIAEYTKAAQDDYEAFAFSRVVANAVTFSTDDLSAR